MIFRKVSFLFFFCLISFSIFAQGTWVQKANVFLTPRAGVAGFSIGNKGYFGTGWKFDLSIYYTDFWEWDQSSNVWTQKASFPSSAVADAVGFSIGTKGYFVGGVEQSFGDSDMLWEWDQSTNTWTQKANFPPGGIAFAVGFSIGTKGYLGCGDNGSNEFWEWNQATNAWSKVANFPGATRSSAVGFAINTKGYIGTGNTWLGSPLKDLWEFDPATNSWTQKADLPGAERGYASGFSIGSYGYIGTGYDSFFAPLSDLWMWSQSSNTWAAKANYPHVTTDIDHAAFTINCKGYFGTGCDDPGTPSIYYNDFWEYTPDITILCDTTPPLPPIASPCDSVLQHLTDLNVFSPNADGVNDLFTINGIDKCYKFSMEIFNRWGVLMFSTSQANNYWDGRTPAGLKASEGTYYYIFSVNGQVRKGFVTLVR